MTRSRSMMRPALALFSVRLILQQIGLGLLVFTLALVWLRIPDSSAINVAGSLLLALIVLAIGGSGETALILRLSGHPRTRARLLRGTLLVMVGIALWFVLSSLLDHIRGNDSLYAGYLNSRFPQSLRNLFTFGHVLLLLAWIWTLLEWIGVGVIAVFIFACTASTEPLRAIRHTLRSAIYWAAVVLSTMCTTALTRSLMRWTPGHGLRVEMVSLVLRLTITVLVDAAVVCLLLSIMGVGVRQSDALYVIPAGTPDESQPRTVDNP